MCTLRPRGVYYFIVLFRVCSMRKVSSKSQNITVEQLRREKTTTKKDNSLYIGKKKKKIPVQYTKRDN